MAQKRLVSDALFLVIIIFITLAIKAANAHHLSVPQYDGLDVDAILAFASNHQAVFKYLPDEVEIKKCPK